MTSKGCTESSGGTEATQALALFGGEKAAPTHEEAGPNLFKWPMIGPEDEEAVLRILAKPGFFDEEEVDYFEKEFSEWLGVRHVVSVANGTMGLQAAMWAVGVRRGDEVIGPSRSYWAAVLPSFSLGATLVFADVDSRTLGLDPQDVARRITPKTKAVVVVHQNGYPVDMDGIISVTRDKNIRVIEDASHAHGSLYRGRMVGTLGDVAVFSCCGKTLAIGEGGMIATDNRTIYERVLAFAHNFRFNAENVTDLELLNFAHLPMGAITARMHNFSAALGRVQLRQLPERIQAIDKAMNYFWDLLEGTPGIKPHRPPVDSGSTMGGWYLPHGRYVSEELSGLSVSRFAEAVRAEGWWTRTRTCVTDNLHLHPLLNTADIYGDGRPTRIAFSNRDVRQLYGSLPVSEEIRAFTVPRFSQFEPKMIEKFSGVFKKVVLHHRLLLEGDRGDSVVIPDDRGDG